MADKGKKGKGGVPPPAGKTQDTKKEDDPQVKTFQPKDEVGTRKGCRRYQWELKDSNKEFWIMGHAGVKILSVGCLIAALVMFTGTAVHPLLTLIITMELSVFVFFIIVNSFAIQRYMPFILWPISDLLNDLFATIFLVGAVIFAVQNRQTMPMNYFIAVVLIGVAAFFPLIDICLQRKHFRGKKVKRNVLVPPPRKEEPDAKPKEEAKPAAAAAGGGAPAAKPKDKGKGGKK
ncbi:CKLF-like MARVEL transmembrane domain-containing protein 2 isoform 1-T1 [Molossus nigricans]